LRNVDDHLFSQNRWRTLRVRRASPILQAFADYSPASWWDSRYLPSQGDESDVNIQSIFISEYTFATQINVGYMESHPRVAVFHRRTLTSGIYNEVIIGFPEISPVFVVPHPTEATRNPLMPLTEWWRMIADAREGTIRLAVESRSGQQELRRLGVDPVLYLPPMVGLPPKFRGEGKTPSDHYRLLLSTESYPHLDILQAILSVDEWSSPDGRPVKLILALGEGPGSVQETYRDGLVEAANELLGEGRVEVWDWTLREKFLRRLSRDVDGLLILDRESGASVEANALKTPTFVIEGEKIVRVDVPDSTHHRREARRAFWKGLIDG